MDIHRDKCKDPIGTNNYGDFSRFVFVPEMSLEVTVLEFELKGHLSILYFKKSSSHPHPTFFSPSVSGDCGLRLHFKDRASCIT